MNYYKSRKQNHLKKTMAELSRSTFTIKISVEDAPAKDIIFSHQSFIGTAAIEKSTVVRESINRRQQDLLKATNLDDLLDSMRSSGQMFPAIGVKRPDGLIEVLDGSRRRKALLMTDGTFKVWVTNSPLKISEAQYIAKTANQQKKISEFELGHYYQSLMQSGCCADQKAVALQEGVATSKVSRCIKASAINPILLDCFDDHNLLSVRDLYRLIQLEKKRLALDLSPEQVLAAMKQKIAGCEDSEEQKNQVLSAFDKVLQASKVTPPKPITQHKKLFHASKDKHVTLSSAGDKHVITLSRIEKDKVDAIVRVVASILEPS